MTKNAKKLIWTEGGVLTQQHFQSWDKWLHREHYLDREQKGLWGGYSHLKMKSSP